MAFTQQLQYETLKSIDSATFTGAYQAIGTQLTHPASLVKMVNNSGVLVTVSIDGTNDHDICPAGSFWLYDVTTNNPMPGQGVFIPQGRQYFVKGAASTGLVYLVVQYVVQS